MKYLVSSIAFVCLCILGWYLTSEDEGAKLQSAYIQVDNKNDVEMKGGSNQVNITRSIKAHEVVGHVNEEGPDIQIMPLERKSLEVNADKASSHQVMFDEIYNDHSKDLSGINSDLVEAGKMFLGDLYTLKDLSLDAPVTIDVDGAKWRGKVTKNKSSPSLPSNSYVKIKFNKQGEYMTAYFDGKSTKGKIYTSEGSYIYEHNGQVGFILSIYEYKKMNNALHID